MTDQPILHVDGLGHDVASRTLWDDLAFTVAHGEVLAVRGASGQGKSTLLRCLGGLQQPTRGKVRIGGEELGSIGERRQRSLRRDKTMRSFPSGRFSGICASFGPTAWAAKRSTCGSMRHSTPSVLMDGSVSERVCSAAASSNGWRSPGCSRSGRAWCWPTSRRPRLMTGALPACVLGWT